MCDYTPCSTIQMMIISGQEKHKLGDEKEREISISSFKFTAVSKVE